LGQTKIASEGTQRRRKAKRNHYHSKEKGKIFYQKRPNHSRKKLTCDSNYHSTEIWILEKNSDGPDRYLGMGCSFCSRTLFHLQACVFDEHEEQFTRITKLMIN